MAHFTIDGKYGILEFTLKEKAYKFLCERPYYDEAKALIYSMMLPHRQQQQQHQTSEPAKQPTPATLSKRKSGKKKTKQTTGAELLVTKLSKTDWFAKVTLLLKRAN